MEGVTQPRTTLKILLWVFIYVQHIRMHAYSWLIPSKYHTYIQSTSSFHWRFKIIRQHISYHINTTPRQFRCTISTRCSNIQPHCSETQSPYSDKQAHCNSENLTYCSEYSLSQTKQSMKFTTQLIFHNSSFLATARIPLAAASNLNVKGSLT